jgi:hypothetical protein
MTEARADEFLPIRHCQTSTVEYRSALLLQSLKTKATRVFDLEAVMNFDFMQISAAQWCERNFSETEAYFTLAADSKDVSRKGRGGICVSPR